jgi:hypothetical protein
VDAVDHAWARLAWAEGHRKKLPPSDSELARKYNRKQGLSSSTREQQPSKPRARYGTRRSQIRSILSDGQPKNAAEIAQIMDHGLDSVRSALVYMASTGAITRVRIGYYTIATKGGNG